MQLLIGEESQNIATTQLIICSYFYSEFSAPRNYFQCNGTLLNKNTIESFKNCDKTQVLKEESEKLYECIVDGSCLKDPSLLVSFVLLSYAVSSLQVDDQQ